VLDTVSDISGTPDGTMETLEQLEKALKTKLGLLRLTNESTAITLSNGKLTALQRQQKTLREKVDEVHVIKVAIQKKKLEQEVEYDVVRQWTTETQENLAPFEDAITELERVMGEVNQVEKERCQDHENQVAARAREIKLKDQLEFDKAQLEQKLHYEKKIEEERAKQSSVQTKGFSKTPNIKLHKLEMTKFNGTHTDWLRFWNQFEAEIHTADIPAVTKFTYLKESIEPKVRVAIDGLPFTTEGYERARNILKSRYGKTSEIINAYVQNIMSLPTIHGSHPAKVHEFYEKLMANVQSLETLGKLKEVNGYVRTTIDKLEGVRGDLLRNDDDWQQWEFPQLVDALRRWTERNPLKIGEKAPSTMTQQIPMKRGRNYNTRQQERDPRPPRVCVYCEGLDHKSVDCQKCVTIDDRKRKLRCHGRCSRDVYVGKCRIA